ncbi:MAG: hypothetical protein ABEK50_10185 [bacterium]
MSPSRMEIESILEDLEEEQPHQGIRQARELLEGDSLSDPQFSELSYGLATGLFKIGSYHEALEWLERTDSDRRWMLEGFCWMNLRDPVRARGIRSDNERPPTGIASPGCPGSRPNG